LEFVNEDRNADRVGDWRFIHTIHSAAQTFFIGVNGATDHRIPRPYPTSTTSATSAEAGDLIMIDEAGI
jgi:hypothetical protein